MLDRTLGLGVQGAGRLVEHEHARVAQQGPGDGDPLLLTAGETVPAGADHRVVPVGQPGDQVVDLRGLGRVLDLGVGRVGPGVAQVLPDRGVQQVGLLADHAHDGGEVGELHVADVDAVDAHRAAGGVVEPGYQRGEGGLAGPGLADQGQRGAGRDIQVDAGQGGPVRAGIGEADAVEPDMAGYHLRDDLDRVDGVVHLDGQVQVLEDPREQGQRADHGHAGVEQPGQRPEEAGLQGGEGDQGADGHRARGDRQAGGQVDDGRDGGEDDAHRGHPPAAGQLGAQLQVDQAGRGGGEPLDEGRPGTHRLGQLDAVDRQSFLDGDVQVGQFTLLLGGDGPAHPGHPAAQVDRGRHDDQRDEGKLPGQGDHGDRGGDRGGEVGGHGRRGRGDHGLHAADVVGDAGLDLAGPGPGEERDRLPLQVAEHAGAQPVHDLLADLGADKGLDHAERGGDGGDADHAGDQQDQQPDVPVREGGVDHRAEQER